MKKSLIFIFILFLLNSDTKASNTIYCDALSGGGGERLWPLSRKDHPKQFLSISGEQTLLEDTLDRLSAIPGNKKLWVTTTKQYKKKIKEYAGNRLQKIVAEPTANNTAPAILLTCFLIEQEDPNALIVFSPTDHYIGNQNSFADAMEDSLKYAEQSSSIVLLGVTPTRPATGYGYIELEKFEKETHKNKIARVISFHEKPNLESALEFIEANNMLWNVGIFCGSVRTFIDAFEEYAPDIFNGMIKYLAGEREYATIPKVSFDYAVLEKYPDIMVKPVCFDWSDIGDMKTFLSLQKKEMSDEKIIKINANENLVSCKKGLVVLVDVDDLCVVESDGILLVIKQDSVNRIREVVAKLKENAKLNNYRWKTVIF